MLGVPTPAEPQNVSLVTSCPRAKDPPILAPFKSSTRGFHLNGTALMKHVKLKNKIPTTCVLVAWLSSKAPKHPADPTVLPTAQALPSPPEGNHYSQLSTNPFITHNCAPSQ